MTRSRDIADQQKNLGGAVAPFVGGKNAAINGGFDIWARGTSFAAPNYSADRWYAIGGSTTYSQETTAANLPTGFRYGIKMLMGGTNVPLIAQAIETANALQYAGKRVILSYYVSSTASSDCLIRLDSSTTVDNAMAGTWTTLSAATGFAATASTTSTMTRVSCAYDVPSNTQSLRILIGSNVNITSGNNMTITGVQLEMGSQATPFSRAGGSIGGELALCQRYYYRSRTDSSFGNLATGGFCSATNTAILATQFPVVMRAVPSSIETTGTPSNYCVINATGSVIACTVITYDSQTNAQIGAFVVNTAGSLTAGQGTQLRANNSVAAYIGWSAEL